MEIQQEMELKEINGRSVLCMAAKEDGMESMLAEEEFALWFSEASVTVQ